MYTIGQVIYTVIETKKTIVPVKIVEEITVKKLDFEKTTYKVLLPNSKKQIVDLERFDLSFSDIDSASEYLINNAKKAIEDITFKALDLEEKHFSENIDNVLEDEIDNDSCNNENNNVKIDLGDGTTAKISVDQLEKLNQ